MHNTLDEEVQKLIIELVAVKQEIEPVLLRYSTAWLRLV